MGVWGMKKKELLETMSEMYDLAMRVKTFNIEQATEYGRMAVEETEDMILSDLYSLYSDYWDSMRFDNSWFAGRLRELMDKTERRKE